MTNDNRSKFQRYVAYNIMYAKTPVEKEAIIAFSTIEEGGVKKHAREVTDLSHIQLEIGSHYIDDYSNFLVDEESYIKQLENDYVHSN